MTFMPRYLERLRMRPLWRAARLCLRCGDERRRGLPWCSACVERARAA